VSERVRGIQASAEKWSAERVLRWAFDEFQDDLAIASAFGAEGMAVIDMASRIRGDFRLFTLDTGFLFPETYKLMETVEERYGIQVERIYSALTPEEQERRFGKALWKRDPDGCCKLRKIEPLKRKLADLEAWVTSIRREQTAARAAAGKVEWDEKFELVKVNPIADWTHKQVWNYLYEHDVPYNPLHDQNFPSIGCMHCTRAIEEGEDLRAGRWAGNEKTECGLHSIQPATS
jgi:phosphoadenosine phosphosulfate reductase